MDGRQRVLTIPMLERQRASLTPEHIAEIFNSHRHRAEQAKLQMTIVFTNDEWVVTHVIDEPANIT